MFPTGGGDADTRNKPAPPGGDWLTGDDDESRGAAGTWEGGDRDTSEWDGTSSWQTTNETKESSNVKTSGWEDDSNWHSDQSVSLPVSELNLPLMSCIMSRGD